MITHSLDTYLYVCRKPLRLRPKGTIHYSSSLSIQRNLSKSHIFDRSEQVCRVVPYLLLVDYYRRCYFLVVGARRRVVFTPSCLGRQ
jgi:hypothetical protein